MRKIDDGLWMRICTLKAQGMSDMEVGHRLGLDEKTITNERNRRRPHKKVSAKMWGRHHYVNGFCYCHACQTAIHQKDAKWLITCPKCKNTKKSIAVILSNKHDRLVYKCQTCQTTYTRNGKRVR